MASCLPKFHKAICDEFTPDFIPSGTDCIMPGYDIFRAYTFAGGTFFRAIELGASGETIQVKCEWLTSTGVVTTNELSCKSVRLTVSKVGYPTEVYNTPQEIDNAASPTTWLPLSDGGISDLRNQININSNLITMPPQHFRANWGTGSGSPPLFDDNHIGYFTSSLSDAGDDAPSGPAGIRTGPTYSLFLKRISETKDDPSLQPDSRGEEPIVGTKAADGIDAGYESEVMIVSAWDGTRWIGFDQHGSPIQPSCYDPNDIPHGLCT